MKLGLAVAVLNEACADARTADGRALSVRFDVDPLRVMVMHFDENNVVTDAREWQWLALPAVESVTDERFAAFTAGLHAATRAVDPEWLFPEEFPAFPLLEIASLVTADDFTRAMSSRDACCAALASQFAASLCGRHGLDEVTAQQARALYDLSVGTESDGVLAAHLAALVAVPRHALALLEAWADDVEQNGDGWIARNGGSLRTQLATDAQCALDAALDDDGRARLAKLRERGLVRAPLPDVDALFDAGRVAGNVLDVGAIELGPSDGDGSVVACDPYFCEGMPAIALGPMPARGLVQVLLVHLEAWGTRVSIARLVLHEARARTWRRTGRSFFVDAGLACFMSVAARDAFRAKHLEGFDAGNPDVLGPELASGAKAFIHAIDAVHTMAVFTSGLGDGGYEVLEGLDDTGALVALAIDFTVD